MIVLLAAAIGCGSSGKSGPPLPACGPGVDATALQFVPSHVEGGSFGSGPQPSPAPSTAPPAGSRIVATSATATLDLELENIYLTQVQALCVSGASLAGSFSSGSGSLTPRQALVEVDSVGAEPGNPNIQDGFSQGKVDAVWLQANDGTWYRSGPIAFGGVFYPVP